MNNARLADGAYWEQPDKPGEWHLILIRNGMAYRMMAVPYTLNHADIGTVYGPLREPPAIRPVQDQAHAALEAVVGSGSTGVQSEPAEA